MLRSLAVLPLILFLLIACSKDQPAPVAPAGKVLTSTVLAPTNLRAEAITDTSVRLVWGRIASADDYDLFYKTFSASRWSLVSHHGPDTSNTVFGLIPDTQYSWTVKADSADQSSDWAPVSLFKTLGAISTLEDTSASVILETVNVDLTGRAEDSAQSQFNIQLIFPNEVLANFESLTPAWDLEESPDWLREAVAEHTDHLSYTFHPKAKEIIREAAQIWEKVIVGDIPSSTYSYIFGNYEIEFAVDDVIIIVENGYNRSNAAIHYPEDGAMFNRAGQIFISTHYLEAKSSNIGWGPFARNQLRRIAVHEIGHVLGLTNGLHRQAEFVKDGFFIGKNAVRLFGGQPIPLFNKQTAWAHWDHNFYPDGVMTPGGLFIPPELESTKDIYNFVTDVEVGALEDFGYEVDYSFARSGPFVKSTSMP